MCPSGQKCDSLNVPNKTALKTVNQLKTILPSNLSRINKNYLLNILDNHLIHYSSPINLTYAWSFGSLAGICLIIQMISGIFLVAPLSLLFHSTVQSAVHEDIFPYRKHSLSSQRGNTKRKSGKNLDIPGLTYITKKIWRTFI
jgi:hypothetical protein